MVFLILEAMGELEAGKGGHREPNEDAFKL